MTSRTDLGADIANVNVRGTGWGPRVDLLVSEPDGTIQQHVIDIEEGEVLGPESGPMSFGFDRPGINTVQLSATETGCAATLRFQVAPDSGTWASGHGDGDDP